MSNERMTFEEMAKKYPDEWLFIVDCEHSASTELISGIVAVHSLSRDIINKASDVSPCRLANRLSRV